MMTRFELRKDDHPEGNRYSIVDTETGLPACVAGIQQIWLPQEDAEDLAAMLNEGAGATLAA